MSVIAAPFTRTLSRKLLAPWWLFLVPGIGWMLVALIVLRFDYTSVNAIAILLESSRSPRACSRSASRSSPRAGELLYGLLAVVFIAAGVVLFIHPGDTFLALAAVMSFVLIFAGTFDIITAISARKEIEVWWLQLVGGIIELSSGSGRPAITGAARSSLSPGWQPSR